MAVVEGGRVAPKGVAGVVVASGVCWEVAAEGAMPLYV